MSLARLAFPLALAAFALGLPAAASANGDPASDVLGYRNVFVPGEFSPPSPSGELPPNRVAQLRTLVGNANAKRYRIKVALISAPVDLGLIYQLWRKPQSYARFLGSELFGYWQFRGRLLVVMPNGYGFYNDGKPVKRENRLLQALAPPESALDIARAAEVALLRVAARDGVKLTLPPLPAASELGDDGDERNLAWVGAGVFTLIAIAAFVYAWLRSRRTNRAS